MMATASLPKVGLGLDEIFWASGGGLESIVWHSRVNGVVFDIGEEREITSFVRRTRKAIMKDMVMILQGMVIIECRSITRYLRVIYNH
jgi:hypothetical protein